MMKKLLFTLLMLAGASVVFAQNTYYWAGGATASSLTGTSWSETLGGPATLSRSAVDDILVFDNATVVFDITAATIGKLVIQNNADITFTRSFATAGTTSLVLAGVSGVGLEVNNGKLRLLGSTSTYNFTLSLPLGSTGSVTNGGQVFITGTANNRISTATVGGFVFASGTSCTVNSAISPFDTAANSVENSTVLDNGASLNYYGGISPFGNTTSLNVLRVNPQSIINIYATPAASGVFAGRVLGNVVIKTGVTINLNSPSETFVKMNDLTIENGATLNLRVSGGNAITGNLLVNGTLGVGGVPGSSQLILAGHTPQSISGSGTINALGGLTIANDANVTLLKNLVLNGTSTSNVIGRLNFGTNTISGTSNFQFRNAATLSTGGGATTAGSNTIQMSNSATYNALVPTVGLLVTGAGIPANSYIIGTSSANFNFTISNFATATASNLEMTTIGSSATLATSNSGGPDASLITTGNATKAIGAGTNLIINTATATPFATTYFTSGGPQSNISYGNVSLAAASITNTDATITGILNLNSSKLTIRPGDNLTMASSSSFTGANNNAYIVTDANTLTGTVGVLKIADISSSKLIPVGSTISYLPVTLTPTTSSDFTINVFEGATVDATPNGTALTADQKKRMVNAVWNINRTAGTGNCNVTFGWTNALEGTDFAIFTNSQIGIASYTADAYTAFLGNGDNTANTATHTVSTFAPMIVGELNTTLPVKLLSFTAKGSLNTVQLAWKTTSEKGLAKYIVQHAQGNSAEFKNIYAVAAHNLEGTFDYSYVDVNPVAGNNYYRLISEDLDGTQYISEVKSVNINGGDIVNAYPNPIINNSFNVSGLTAGDVIKISDLKGAVVYNKISDGNSINKIDLQSVNPGVYFLSIENSGKITTTKRLIKL